MSKSIYASKDDASIRRGLFVMPNPEGSAITAFEDTPEEGFITLMEVRPEMQMLLNSTKAVRKYKFANINGAHDDLSTFLAMWEDDGLIPGRICTREWLDDENLPDAIKDSKSYNNDKKRAGTDGVLLTVDGIGIISKRTYDQTGSVEDVLIAHDNSDEIRQDRALKKVASEKQPAEKTAKVSLDGK